MVLRLPVEQRERLHTVEVDQPFDEIVIGAEVGVARPAATVDGGLVHHLVAGEGVAPERIRGASGALAKAVVAGP